MTNTLKNTHSADTLALVLLGHALGKDGSPSTILIERLHQALNTFSYPSTSHIIVSGRGYTPGWSESKVMKTWLIDQGIPPELIIEEDHSMDTVENVIFSTEILIKNNCRRVLVITSPSHELRAVTLFKAHFSKNNVHCHVANTMGSFAFTHWAIREKLLLIKDLARIFGFYTINTTLKK